MTPEFGVAAVLVDAGVDVKGYWEAGGAAPPSRPSGPKASSWAAPSGTKPAAWGLDPEGLIDVLNRKGGEA